MGLLGPSTREKLIVISGEANRYCPCPAEFLRQYIWLDSVPERSWPRHQGLERSPFTTSVLGAGLSYAENDSDVFFSASGESDIDSPNTAHSRPIARKAKDVHVAQPLQQKEAKARSPGIMRLSLALRDAALGKKSSSDESEEVEEGVLMVGKEERDLLLNFLAEARERQAA